MMRPPQKEMEALEAPMLEILLDSKTASEFVVDCDKFDEDINVYYGRFTIDGKSILGVLSCDLTQPLKVEILTEDADTRLRFETVMRKYEK